MHSQLGGCSVPVCTCGACECIQRCQLLLVTRYSTFPGEPPVLPNQYKSTALCIPALYRTVMAAGGQNQGVGSAVSSSQDASGHIAQVLLSAAAVKELEPITLDQFPQLARKVEAAQRKIRSDVDKISAELPNDMRTCVERIQTCSEEYLRFSEAYSARYEGGWINALFRWLSLPRDIHEIQQYLQYLAQNMQRIVEPAESLKKKLNAIKAALQDDLAQLDEIQDEYRQLVSNGKVQELEHKKQELKDKKQELKDALAEVNSRYYHALMCIGWSVIGAVAVGTITIHALINSTPKQKAVLAAGPAVVGVNEASQALPITVNRLTQEGILGNAKKLSKARDEWHELMQKRADLCGGRTALCGGGAVFVHAGLKQLSQLVTNLQGDLAHVIADWEFVRSELQTTADQIKAATGQDQVAVILRNVKTAAGRWEAAMNWAKACLPRPDPLR